MKNFISVHELESALAGDSLSRLKASADYQYTRILGEFSIMLAEYRYEHRISQADLASMLGITQSMVSQYEAGTRNISVKKICEYCEKLGYVPQLSFAAASPLSNQDHAKDSSASFSNSSLLPVADTESMPVSFSSVPTSSSNIM